jgi:hypothetical protein
MSIDRAAMAIPGTVDLVSLLQGLYVQPNWYWHTAFVGANLLQASFTGFCPLAFILRKAGLKSGAAF